MANPPSDNSLNGSRNDSLNDTLPPLVPETIEVIEVIEVAEAVDPLLQAPAVQKQGALSETIAEGLAQLEEGEELPAQGPDTGGEEGGNDVFMAERTRQAEQSRQHLRHGKTVSANLLYPWLNNMDPYDALRAKPVNGGFRLNNTDNKLATSHLEQYIPTAATRYQLMRDRLNKDLTAVCIEIDRYRKLPGFEYRNKVEALEARASLLRRQIIEIDRHLMGITPFQKVFNQLEALSRFFKQSGGLMTLLQRDPEKRAAARAAEEVTGLQEILESHLHDPLFSAEQLGELVNRYDKSLKRAEALAQKLNERKGLREKLNLWLHRVINRYYGKHVIR
ncbi:MAG: hypothetical protein KC474_05430 [Cyanobacteria bacterium HKST-UBA04]|nr:hypothetical protein [Cyanobacteria bacterium HKST-UBA04]